MSLKTILLLIFTLLYFIVGHWLYTQKIPNICCGEETTITTTAVIIPEETEPLPEEINDDKPILFNWSDTTVITSRNFENFKESIFRDFSEEYDLEITGEYFADEVNPEGYENMGFARAAQVRELFKGQIPEDRILINSKLMDNIASMETDPFEAIEFNLIPHVKSDETTIAKVDLDRILIFFPFNSRIQDKNKEVGDYLEELAEYLQESGKSALITGHTDSTGDAQYNYDLGLQRALMIRKQLVELGTDIKKISVDSKGENQPVASNQTPSGEQKNRRVVITLK